MKAIAATFTPEEYQTIQDVLSHRHRNATVLATAVQDAELQVLFSKEANAINKLLGLFHLRPNAPAGPVITITAAITAPEPSFKDRVLTYLYKTYPQHHEVIRLYIIAIENVDVPRGPETQWEYFINKDNSLDTSVFDEDGILHTGTVDEDFKYYKDYMYPDQLYDAAPASTINQPTINQSINQPTINQSINHQSTTNHSDSSLERRYL